MSLQNVTAGDLFHQLNVFHSMNTPHLIRATKKEKRNRRKENRDLENRFFRQTIFIESLPHPIFSGFRLRKFDVH